MLRDIKESDWKLLRQFKTIALDRLCERVLAEIRYISSDAGRTNHERYLAVYEAIHRCDREIADTFNDLRRSNALVKLAQMKSLKLLTDEELSQFSEQTREVLDYLAGNG